MATSKPGVAAEAAKVAELFGVAKLPMFDVEAMFATHKKNIDAFVAANKVMFTGYQDVCRRQFDLIGAGMADAKDNFAELQGKPMTAEQASANLVTMRTAFEKAATDAQELSEMIAKANTDAFEIVKARFDEAVGEFKAVTEKIAA